MTATLLPCVDDIHEFRLERGTSDEETVNVGLLAELLAVLLADAAAVEDAGLVGDLLADLLGEPLADHGVDLLGLLGGGDLAGADGPDGLVGDDDAAPVGDLGLEGGELAGDVLEGLSRLALLQGLAAAPDDAEPGVGGVLGLGGDDGVALVEDGAALRVAQDGPVDLAVLELRHRDLAREGAVGLVEDVLCGDTDLGLGELADEEEVEDELAALEAEVNKAALPAVPDTKLPERVPDQVTEAEPEPARERTKQPERREMVPA